MVPFEEWPAERSRDTLAMTRKGREALLDAAGYKRGADGIRFKIGVVFVVGSHDVSYIELVAKYYDEIGIDVELKPMAVCCLERWYRRKVLMKEYPALLLRRTNWNPMVSLPGSFIPRSRRWNYSNVNDPVDDAMVEAAEAATTLEEQQRLVREAAIYSIRTTLASVG